MRNYLYTILTVFFLSFVAGCLLAETKDSKTENQASYVQTMPDSFKSDSIQHILTKVVDDGKATGIIIHSIMNVFDNILWCLL